MSTFQPQFQLTAAAARALASVEGDRVAIEGAPLTVGVLTALRRTARLVSTHYSTQIEGNRLTQEQVAEALEGGHFPGRERDETEVRNHYAALQHVESIADEAGRLVREREAQQIHGLVMTGRATATRYREGQNVIRDARSGAIVYVPPEPDDVPGLMAGLFDWANTQLREVDWPIPVVAAVVHYQFAIIHPYFDGNGRTARLLTTLLLHRAGYGLKGIYSLDEHYARDLRGYYDALTVGPSHNYYLGRAEADLSPFVEYFCTNMAAALAAVRRRATEAIGEPDSAVTLRQLDPRQRAALTLFQDHAQLAAADLAEHLGLSRRTIRFLAQRWVGEGFLEVTDASRKRRRYQLAPEYERLLGQ